ncbi:MAG TPA: DUF1499 domain-containing protein [Dongiaceae bacterium]|jgi:uncharacterized protein (DUF1499 family)|nr:DUF1499 domain-containing protein [Dongiaceae bacterium]
MRRWGSRLLWTLLAIALAFGIFQLIGPERVWALIGPADLGPVSFETLQRRATANDALACPLNLCQAKADVTSPAFAIAAHDLRLAFGRAVADEPRLVKVDSDDSTLTERYIQRSRVMRYPDTIVVRFIDLPDGRSTIALYSRSQLGKGDLGVNLARIHRWLAALEAQTPAATVP